MDDANGIRVAFPAAPALDADDLVALVEDLELEGFHDAPLQAAVDVLLPVRGREIGFLLREHERVDAAVEMGVLCGFG